MSDLERTGYSLIVEGGDTFNRILEQAGKYTETLANATNSLSASFRAGAASSELAEAAIDTYNAALNRVAVQSQLTQAIVDAGFENEEAAAVAAAQVMAQAMQASVTAANKAAAERVAEEKAAQELIQASERATVEFYIAQEALKASEQAKYAAQRIADEQAVADAAIKSAQNSAAVFEAEMAKEVAAAKAAADAKKSLLDQGKSSLLGSLGIDDSAVASITKFAGSLGLVSTGVGLAAAAMVAASAVIDGLKAGFSALTAVLDNVLQALVNLAQQGFQYVIGVITQYQSIMQTVAGVTALAIGVIGAASVDLAAKYQQAMNIVRTYSAISAGSVQELDANMASLNKTIVTIGTTTTVSMLTAASAAEDLVKAGVDVKTQAEGALKATTDLTIASAGELKAADAALAVAQGLHTYGLEGAEATRVTNSLTAAAQLSNASFQEVITSFKYLGPEAHNVRMSIEETAAAIGILGQQGIVGSTAGTNLRQMLVSLEKPSETAIKVLNNMGVSLFTAQGAARPFADVLKDLERSLGTSSTSMSKALGIMEQYGLTTRDASGNMKPYAQIVDEITRATGENAKALLGVTDAQRLFNLETAFTVRGAHAAAVLIDEGSDAFKRMTQAAHDLKAEDIANLLLLPLASRAEIAKNGIEALGIELGTGFLGILSAAANAVITFIGSWDITKLELIGQAITALITGAGFNKLYEQISQAFGSDTATKIDFVIMNLRKIADTVVDVILPALGHLKDAIIEPFKDVTAPDNFFNSVNNLRVGIVNLEIEAAKIIEYIAGVIQAFNATTESGQTIKDVIVGLITLAIEPLISMVVATIAAFVTLVTVAYAVGLAMLGDAQATDDAGQGWSDFLTQLQPVFPALANLIRAIGTLAHSIAEFVTSWIDAAKNIASAFLSAAGVVLNAVEKMSGALMHAPDAAVALMATATNAAAKAAQGAMDASSGAASVIGHNISDVGEAIKGLAAEVDNVKLNIPAPSTIDRQLSDFLQKALDAANSLDSKLPSLGNNLKNEGNSAGTAAGPNENFRKELEDGSKAASKAATAIKDLAKALDAAQDSMDKAGRSFNEGIDKILQGYDDKMQKASDDATKKAVDATTNALKQITEIDTNTQWSRFNRDTKQQATEYIQGVEDAIKDGNDKIEQGLKEFIDTQRQTRKEGYQDQERALKDSLDHEYQDFTQAQADRLEVLKQSLAQQEQDQKQHEQDSVGALGNTQSKEEAELRRTQQLRIDGIKKAQELAAAKTPEERARIEQQFSNQQQVQQQQFNDELELQNLKERHSAQKRTMEQQNAKADLDLRQRDARTIQAQEQQNAIDAKTEKERLDAIYNADVRKNKEIEAGLETKENEAIAAQKLKDEKNLTAIKRLDRLALQALDDTLEDMANDRRKAAIKEELDAKLAAIVIEYIAKTTDISGKTAEEIAAEATKLNDKLNDAQSQFQDQLKNHADAGESAIADFTTTFNDHFQSLQQQADSTTSSINALIAAATAANQENITGAVNNAQPNALPASSTFTPSSPGATAGLTNFGTGGLPINPGGSIHNYPTGPTTPSGAIVATPAPAGSIYTQAGQAVGNSVNQTTNNFNLNANYSQTQSPSSIANDVGAMAAIAGGS